MQLEGGAFQKLFDAYLYKKYGFKNIQTLGVQTGTNEPTKGTPDSYVLTDEGKYILINYGTVESKPADKIKADILSCFNSAKLDLDVDKIERIICGHCSSNIHIEQFESIKESVKGVTIELIGIDTLSHDLSLIYPHIAKDHLGVSIDTNQFFDIDDFVMAYDANGINAPINCNFLHRETEITDTCNSIDELPVTVLTGPSGIGKTRLAVEVCRQYEEKEYKVYCVRSSGILLYDDIKYYVDAPGHYLIFFDDANMVASWEGVLSTLLSMPQEYDIKLLVTVRDYAKDRVLSSIKSVARYNVVEIGSFKDEEIKEILKKDLGILNSNYLNKIVEIANGNIRLAFLAGMRAVDGGYKAIQNAEDIFRNYYGHVLNESKLLKEDIIILFLIAVAGPVKYSENKLYADLKEQYGKGISEEAIVEKLYSLELIDWFKNEITRVADQSFGNFVLYHVLYEKKWINVEKLISLSFPQYKQKIIYVLNTLTNIFTSHDLIDYVNESIISAWNNAPKEHEKAYLESFYLIDQDKSLCMLKEHIEKEKTVEFDLRNFDFEKKKNNQTIKTKEIAILGGFKYTESVEDALELLLLYFSKRPDLVMDCYFSITEEYMFDKYSGDNKYVIENLVLDKLWGASNNGEDYNNTVLYIHVCAYTLKTEFTFTEESRNKRAVNFVRMSIGFSDEIAALRSKIWESFSVLRQKDAYRDTVNTILSEVHFNGLDEENSKAYLLSDLDAIYSVVLENNVKSFADAKIVDRYKEVAEQIGASVDDRYLKACENKQFNIYKMLTREHILGRSIDEDEKTRRDSIANEIQQYELQDYHELITTCCFLEEAVKPSEHWTLSRGLDVVFELLEKKPDFYSHVISDYFESGAPFSINAYHQIGYLLKCYGYEKTYELIGKYKFKNRERWMTCLWESVDAKSITSKIASDYKIFLQENLASDNPIIPSASMLSLNNDSDKEIKKLVVAKLLENPELAYKFMQHGYHDEDAQIVVDVFAEDVTVLSQIYLDALTIGSHFDYGGNLFAKIFELDSHIWNGYVDWLKDNIHIDSYEEKIIDLVWNCEEWKKHIEYAFSTLIQDISSFLVEQSARILFGKREKSKTEDRKKAWLLEKLHECGDDVKLTKRLVAIVVTVIPDMRTEYILEFLKINKRIDDFKDLELFSLSNSWSGSEIPLINNKIDYLVELKAQLRGIDYIEHRRYLEECRASLEDYKKKVELREYLENEDYA